MANQQQFGLGAIKVEQADRLKAVPYKALKMKTSPIDLPAEYRLKRVANYYQNGFNMCVSMAISRFAAHAYRAELGKDVKFAPAFIYGNRISDTYTGEGMHPDKAIADFIKNGVPFWDSLPFIGTYPECKAKITDALKAKALPQHALSAVCMFPEHCFMPNDCLRPEEIAAIKTYLYEKQMPVIFVMDIYRENFCNCYKNGGKVGKVDFQKDICDGTHAMVIEGWNDFGMIVANSWGDTWGDGTGDCNVSWGYNSYMDFWAITDYVEPKPEPPTPPVPPDPPPIDPPKPPIVPEFKGFNWKYDAKKKKLTIHITDKKGYDCTIKPDGKKTKSLGFSISKLVAPFTFTVYGKDGSKTTVKV